MKMLFLDEAMSIEMPGCGSLVCIEDDDVDQVVGRIGKISIQVYVCHLLFPFDACFRLIFSSVRCRDVRISPFLNDEMS